jgi:hypothetical protein
MAFLLRSWKKPALAAADNRRMLNPNLPLESKPCAAWIVLAVAVAASAAGCTTQRNPRYCGDGACIDPAYPFCDVNGMFGDLKQQCVAVDCAPDAFVACRGDDELRCNATGTNYDVTRCELGCDAAGGCRLCEANQTACTNGKVSTCDAAGNVVSSEACPLGCFEDQPRCRELDPSNNLSAYFDMQEEPRLALRASSHSEAAVPPAPLSAATVQLLQEGARFNSAVASPSISRGRSMCEGKHPWRSEEVAQEAAFSSRHREWCLDRMRD